MSKLQCRLAGVSVEENRARGKGGVEVLIIVLETRGPVSG